MSFSEDLLYRERPRSGRCPMERSRRAKQFSPFDALKGFTETVHREEILYEVRRTMGEDRKEALEHKLRHLQEGQKVRVIYFAESLLFPGRGSYPTLEGTLEEVPGSRSLADEVHGRPERIRIGEQEIPVRDIWDITFPEF